MRARARSIWASLSRSLLSTVSSWSRSKLVAPMSAWSWPAPSPASRISPVSSDSCFSMISWLCSRCVCSSSRTSLSSALVQLSSPSLTTSALAGAFLVAAFFAGAVFLAAAFFAGRGWPSPRPARLLGGRRPSWRRRPSSRRSSWRRGLLVAGAAFLAGVAVFFAGAAFLAAGAAFFAGAAFLAGGAVFFAVAAFLARGAAFLAGAFAAAATFLAGAGSFDSRASGVGAPRDDLAGRRGGLSGERLARAASHGTGLPRAGHVWREPQC